MLVKRHFWSKIFQHQANWFQIQIFHARLPTAHFGMAAFRPMRLPSQTPLPVSYISKKMPHPIWQHLYPQVYLHGLNLLFL
jgi:hypothetical protein